jgi:uncharacterized protein (DUF58 family)
MLSDELLKKVRRIEISTRKMVNESVGGNYKSAFKGQGVQFSEHRVYVPGDDVRHIDWKVSARTRDPLIKKYDEERELSVFLVVDMSRSKEFGSSRALKAEAAAEIGGMIAFAAIHTGDKVGALLFAGQVESIIPPKKGKTHTMRIIRDMLAYEAKTPGTDLKGALEAAGRIMKHTGVVFVISDFIAEGYEVALKRLGKKHDVVAIQIGDERETEIPDLGQILLEDPETGEERLVHLSSYAFKKWHADFKQKHEREMTAAARGSRTEVIKVKTQEDYAEAVVRFLRARARRR